MSTEKIYRKIKKREPRNNADSYPWHYIFSIVSTENLLTVLSSKDIYRKNQNNVRSNFFTSHLLIITKDWVTCAIEFPLIIHCKIFYLKNNVIERKTFSFLLWKNRPFSQKKRTENNVTGKSFLKSFVSTTIILFFYAIRFCNRPKSFQRILSLKSKKTIKITD